VGWWQSQLEVRLELRRAAKERTRAQDEKERNESGECKRESAIKPGGAEIQLLRR